MGNLYFSEWVYYLASTCFASFIHSIHLSTCSLEISASCWIFNFPTDKCTGEFKILPANDLDGDNIIVDGNVVYLSYHDKTSLLAKYVSK